MKIYGDIGSGNCLKVKYTADFLRLPYEWVHVDIMKGEARTDAFAAMNPAKQTPAVDFGNGKHLAQSNAIIRYIARNSPLLPDDAWTQAKIDQWLFWEQYSHEPNIATCRFHMHPKYLGKSKETRDPGKVQRGEQALDLMDRHLTSTAPPPQPSPTRGEGASFPPPCGEGAPKGRVGVSRIHSSSPTPSRSPTSRYWRTHASHTRAGSILGRVRTCNAGSNVATPHCN